MSEQGPSFLRVAATLVTEAGLAVGGAGCASTTANASAEAEKQLNPSRPSTTEVLTAPPTQTPLPTEIAVMVSSTAEPTVITEPTVTPEPTKTPMLEGWAEIAETREIGGRQVVLNEKGEAATRIDGEWYPVDAKGCYYEELLSPEIQNESKVVELYNKLMGETSFTKSDANGLQRYKGSTPVGILGGQYPAIYDREFDSLLSDQKLCYQEGKWYHVTDQVMAVDRALAPTDATLFRAAVGWFDGDQYQTFTYLEETNDRMKNSLDLTNATSKKALSITEAFSQWKELIDKGKQVGLRFPTGILENKDGTSMASYSSLLSQLVQAAHKTVPRYWTESIEDPTFESWANTENNQARFFTTGKTRSELFITNKQKIWRTLTQWVINKKAPVPFIRTITTEK